MFEAMLVGPAIQGLADKLRSVISEKPLWVALLDHEPVKHPADPAPATRGLDLDDEALSDVVVADVQSSDPTPIGKLAAHEVH